MTDPDRERYTELIAGFVSQHPDRTFAELEAFLDANLPESDSESDGGTYPVTGDLAITHDAEPDSYLWFGMSEPFYKAIHELVEAEVIHFKTTDDDRYACENAVPDVPREKWLSVTIFPDSGKADHPDYERDRETEPENEVEIPIESGSDSDESDE